MGPLLLPFGQEVDRDCPETGALAVEDGRSAFDLVTTDGCRTENQVFTWLARDDEIPFDSGLGAAGYRLEHRVKRELGGSPDDFQRRVGILHSGHLDDDPAVTRHLESGLGYPEGVDPATQDLEGPSGHFAVDRDSVGVLRLENDLRATTQIQTEVDRVVENDVDGSAYGDHSPKKTPPGHLGHGGSF